MFPLDAVPRMSSPVRGPDGLDLNTAVAVVHVDQPDRPAYVAMSPQSYHRIHEHVGNLEQRARDLQNELDRVNRIQRRPPIRRATGKTLTQWAKEVIFGRN